MGRSRLSVICVAAAIGLFPIAPPEHVHESEEHGHSHTLIHAHASAHDLAPHSREHHAVFDDDDPPILTLTVAYTVPTVYVMAPPAASVADSIEPPLAGSLHGEPPYVEHLIHGPPRATASLRAPPSVPAL